MKNKHFFILLATIIVIGILGIGALLGYTFKLKEDASIITIVSGERW